MRLKAADSSSGAGTHSPFLDKLRQGEALLFIFSNTVRKLMLCELSAPHRPLARVSGCCRTDLSSALKSQAGGFCSRFVSTRRLESSCEGSCAEPNSKQFVLLSTLASVSWKKRSKPVQAQKSDPFSPPEKVLQKCGSAIRFNFLRS